MLDSCPACMILGEEPSPCHFAAETDTTTAREGDMSFMTLPKHYPACDALVTKPLQVSLSQRHDVAEQPSHGTGTEQKVGIMPAQGQSHRAPAMSPLVTWLRQSTLGVALPSC